MSGPPARQARASGLGPAARDRPRLPTLRLGLLPFGQLGQGSLAAWSRSARQQLGATFGTDSYRRLCLTTALAVGLFEPRRLAALPPFSWTFFRQRRESGRPPAASPFRCSLAVSFVSLSLSVKHLAGCLRLSCATQVNRPTAAAQSCQDDTAVETMVAKMLSYTAMRRGTPEGGPLSEGGSEQRGTSNAQTEQIRQALLEHIDDIRSSPPIVFEAALERSGLLQGLETLGIVPPVRDPNPFDPDEDPETHEIWWTANPEAARVFETAVSERQAALRLLLIGTIIGQHLDGLGK